MKSSTVMLLLACAAACLTGMVRRAAPSLSTLQHLDTAAMFRYGRTPALPVVCVSDSTGRATHQRHITPDLISLALTSVLGQSTRYRMRSNSKCYVNMTGLHCRLCSGSKPCNIPGWSRSNPSKQQQLCIRSWQHFVCLPSGLSPHRLQCKPDKPNTGLERVCQRQLPAASFKS